MLDNHYASTSVWTTDIERSGEAGGQIVDGEQELIFDYREVDVYSQGDAYANHKRKSVAVDADGDTHTLQDAFLSDEHYINSTGRVDGTSAESRERGKAFASSNGGDLEKIDEYDNPKNGDAGFANVYGTVGYEIGSIGEADPEWGRVEDDRDWLSVSADFSAGVADTLSLGLTYLARQQNNKLIGAMYGVETQDLTNYKSTAYWAGQWTGELIGNAAGIGAAAGALKAGAKYVGRHGLTNTAKNVGRGVVKKTTHFVDDVVLNKSNKQCGFFKRLVGKGCFVAGTPVHVAALPNGFQQSLLVSTRLQPTHQQSFDLADSLDQKLLVSKSGAGESKSHPRQTPTQSLIVADESNRSPHLVAIEDVPLGALISAKNPDGSGFDVEMGDAVDWIRIELEFEREEGSTVRIETLRRKTDFGHLRVGDVVPLQTSEAELSGMATVLAVDSDFELAVGEGNPVTARYRTSEVDLIARVTLDSGDVVSGTTKHTIWSVSRRSFVEMAELQVGELVDTELGVASVQRVEVINEPQAVYNLEIAGQHVFRIGKTGVLVHNNDPTDEAYEQLAENASDVAPIRGAGLGRIASPLDDFKRTTGLVFKNDAEAAKAFEWYKRAANAEKGLVIGHGNAAIDQAHSGWEAFRMLANADAVTDASVKNAVRWTEEINLAWIDGAIDAGKPIRLATPFDEVYEGSITWIEIMRIRSRGGTLILDGR